MTHIFRRAIAKQIARVVGASEDELVSMVKVANVTKKKDPNIHFSVSLKNLSRKGYLAETDKQSLQNIAEKLSKQITCDNHIQNVISDRSVLHFRVNQPMLVQNVLQQVSKEKSTFGLKSERISGPRQKVIIEYSSPNIAKPFHAGHLRSTVIGHFLANLNTALGHDVIRMNYLGDWGVQFGLLGVGFSKYGSETALSQNAIQHLFDVYVRIHAEAEKDETIHGQAREFFRRMEEGDDAALLIWKRFRKLSIEEYSKIYGRLGVGFDVYSGESMYGEKALEVIQQLRKSGLMKITEKGTGVVDLSPEHPMNFYSTLMRSDGTTLYVTRDIAAAIERHDNYRFDRMYYVVDKSQTSHFKQMFGTLKTMGHAWADSCHHVKFGKVLGMSTRKGEVVFLQDILDEAKSRMLQNMRKTHTTKVENVEEVAERLGHSAIIIHDLKNNLESDYKFDWDRVLQSYGDTGVYLQYTHARLHSIEKLCGVSLDPECDTSQLTEPEAVHLTQHIAAFEDVVFAAHEELQPKNIVGFLFKLSQLASTAHSSLLVKGSPTNVAQARLLVFSCARQTLANGMRLLGIKPLDQM